METGSGNSTPAVGIDLGTTYSCVGVWLQKRGQVQIVGNDQGRRITRSCVSFTDSERLVGDAAFNDAARNASNTIYAVKRLIGRDFSDTHVKNDIKLWPFKVICGINNKPNIIVEYKGKKEQFTAEEISSMILAKMKKIAESYLGPDHTVKNVVVTVPSYFNNSQRQSTIDAGIIAGLKVMRIMDEPTAAAIAYAFDKMKGNFQRKNVIVFDLGGGTFDVSFVAMNQDVIEVKATTGDTHLGGEDFDNRLVEHFLEDFKRKYKKDISGDSKAMRKLRSACERAKENLSFQKHTMVQIDSLYDNIDFSARISQAQFNDLNEDLFMKCMDILDECINKNNIDKRSIDAVVLVGGSTRIPRVQHLLEEYFKGIDVYKGNNPDEAVAMGATIQAAKLTGQGNRQLNDLVVIDVTPLSLGTGIIGGKMSTIVPQNTRIPTKMTSEYVTAADKQTRMIIDVYEGERAEIKYNNLLGEFVIDGIPPAPRGVGKVDVSFEIDDNGVLIVSAVIKATGSMEKVKITNKQGRLSEEEINRMIRDAERHRAADEEYKRKYEAWISLDGFVYDMRKAATTANVAGKESFSKVIERASKLVAQEPLPEAADSYAMVKELKSICRSFGLCD